LIRALAILAALLWATAAQAVEERVIAGLSQTHVSITTDFSGSEIFIYGAIAREAPRPRDWPLDIIVAVTGPLQPVIVRKKDRRFGIWVNGPGIQVDAAPSFYAVASTRPFRDVISWTDDLRYRVGLDQIVRLIGTPSDLQYPEEYRLAAIRLRRDAGLYVELPGAVRVKEETLFETRIRLPASLVEGNYSARIFLLRNGNVVDVFESSIEVAKVGIERWIYTMAHEQPALYGLMSILVALGAGWMASAAFRIILR
jgi:uncharacterized protein (TIGR02186 family)